MSHPVPESTPPLRVGNDPVDLLSPPTEAEKTADHVSAAEGLKAALAKTARKEPVALRVPTRPGVGLVMDPNFDDESRKAWRKRATSKRRGEDEVDEMMYAQLIIANTCTDVTFGGETATDDEGTPFTFRHKQLWDMLNADGPGDAIRKLFGADPHVLLASGEVLLAAGFDDDLTADPTQAG